jgi:hypothetical protein
MIKDQGTERRSKCHAYVTRKKLTPVQGTVVLRFHTLGVYINLRVFSLGSGFSGFNDTAETDLAVSVRARKPIISNNYPCTVYQRIRICIGNGFSPWIMVVGAFSMKKTAGRKSLDTVPLKVLTTQYWGAVSCLCGSGSETGTVAAPCGSCTEADVGNHHQINL